jgi:hypothetical protein
MAHVGKDYRLQFRRDLALNVFNVNAFAEAYDVLTFTWGGLKGSTLNGVTFQVINVSKAAGVSMTWQSRATPVAGRTFTLNVELVDATKVPLGTCPVRVTMTELVDGLVWFDNLIFGPSHYFRLQATGIGAPAFLAPGYTAPFGSIAFDGPFADWTSYNP